MAVSLEGIGQQAMQIILILVFALIAGGVIATIIIVVRRILRYKVPVQIVEIDSTGNRIFKTDRGGIFFDRQTGMRLFFLRNHRVGLKPDNIPYVKTPKGRMVWLYQHSFRNFSYMTPQISNPNFSFSMGDEDISWGLMAYERGKKMFVNSLLMQLLPWLPAVVMSFIMIVLFTIFFKNIPQLKELIIELRNAAVEIARANAGTVVIGG